MLFGKLNVGALLKIQNAFALSIFRTIDILCHINYYF